MSLPVKRPLDSLGTADSAPFVLNASASPNGAHAPGLDELRQPVSSALGLLLCHGEGGVLGESRGTAGARPEGQH